MKKTIIISDGGETLFKGKPLNMPFKEDAIKQKSIELFDDEDPCIIHQSHIAREFSETVVSRFKKRDTATLNLQDEEDLQSLLDVPVTATLTLKG
ncbi:MAG: hypothetical protein ACOC14_04635 [Bacillota bacterium]